MAGARRPRYPVIGRGLVAPPRPPHPRVSARPRGPLPPARGAGGYHPGPGPRRPAGSARPGRGLRHGMERFVPGAGSHTLHRVAAGPAGGEGLGRQPAARRRRGLWPGGSRGRDGDLAPCALPGRGNQRHGRYRGSARQPRRGLPPGGSARQRDRLSRAIARPGCRGRGHSRGGQCRGDAGRCPRRSGRPRRRARRVRAGPQPARADR